MRKLFLFAVLLGLMVPAKSFCVGTMLAGALSGTSDFIPSQLPNLTLWLDPSKDVYTDTGMTAMAATDGAAVNGWKDQSGHNNHATYAAGGILKLGANGIAGKPALLFSAGNRLETTSFLSSAYDHAVSIYAVCTAPSITTVKTLLTFGTDFQQYMSATTNNSPYQAWGVVMPASSTYFIAPPGARNVHILASKIDGTFKTVFLDARYYLQYDTVSAGLTGLLRIARPGTTANYYWPALIGDILVYNAAHSQAQSRQVIDYLMKKYGEPSLYSIPVVAVQGNSMVFGFGATAGKTDLVTNISANLGNNYNIYHCGVSGRTVDTCISNAPTEIDPGVNPARTDNVFVGWEAINQIAAGSTPAQVMTKIASWCNSRASAGWNKRVIVDCLPHSTYETAREQVNDLLATDFPTATAYAHVYAAAAGITYAQYCVRVSEDPNMGGGGQNTNTTYYYTDAIHPNANGYATLAPYVANGIRAALGQ
jgi:hypothetical protein